MELHLFLEYSAFVSSYVSCALSIWIVLSDQERR